MAISQDWWDRWWEQDWSWEGLAKRRWYGWVVPVDVSGEDDGEPLLKSEVDEVYEYRPATLQDYWKRAQREAGLSDEDFLIRVEREEWVGRELWQKHGGNIHFTLMHLPPKWWDGSETLKADPNNPPMALITLLKIELGRPIQNTSFDGFWGLKGPDNRMQWHGAVLPAFDLFELSSQAYTEDDQIPISVIAINAAFSGKVSFNAGAFAGPSNLASTVFFSDATFMGATFSTDADFADSVFLAKADFLSAAFSGVANFSDVVFSGQAEFGSSTFSDDTSFKGVTFVNYAYFGNASFIGHSDFSDANLCGEVTFWGGAFFGNANFSNVAFFGYANFNSTAFLALRTFMDPSFFLILFLVVRGIRCAVTPSRP
jgi:uncharacterized protein YjbI with pentapeptide repeats